jgi:hypothetical protein
MYEKIPANVPTCIKNAFFKLFVKFYTLFDTFNDPRMKLVKHFFFWNQFNFCQDKCSLSKRRKIREEVNIDSWKTKHTHTHTPEALLKF